MFYTASLQDRSILFIDSTWMLYVLGPKIRTAYSFYIISNVMYPYSQTTSWVNQRKTATSVSPRNTRIDIKAVNRGAKHLL